MPALGLHRVSEGLKGRKEDLGSQNFLLLFPFFLSVFIYGLTTLHNTIHSTKKKKNVVNSIHYSGLAYPELGLTARSQYMRTCIHPVHLLTYTEQVGGIGAWVTT